MDEAEADAEAVAKAFKNMPDDIKELVASNMDKVPKNGQVKDEWFTNCKNFTDCDHFLYRLLYSCFATVLS